MIITLVQTVLPAAQGTIPPGAEKGAPARLTARAAAA